MNTPASYKKEAAQAAKNHQTIQREVAKADKGKKKPSDKAMQAGARKYPSPPFSGKKLKKPGKESTLLVEPMYDARSIKVRIN